MVQSRACTREFISGRSHRYYALRRGRHTRGHAELPPADMIPSLLSCPTSGHGLVRAVAADVQPGRPWCRRGRRGRAARRALARQLGAERVIAMSLPPCEAAARARIWCDGHRETERGDAGVARIKELTKA